MGCPNSNNGPFLDIQPIFLFYLVGWGTVQMKLTSDATTNTHFTVHTVLMILCVSETVTCGFQTAKWGRVIGFVICKTIAGCNWLSFCNGAGSAVTASFLPHCRLALFTRSSLQNADLDHRCTTTNLLWWSDGTNWKWSVGRRRRIRVCLHNLDLKWSSKHIQPLRKWMLTSVITLRCPP